MLAPKKLLLLTSHQFSRMNDHQYGKLSKDMRIEHTKTVTVNWLDWCSCWEGLDMVQMKWCLSPTSWDTWELLILRFCESSVSQMEQLQTLKQVYDAGFMSSVEYEQRRMQIIDQITNTHLTKGIYFFLSLVSTIGSYPCFVFLYPFSF